MAAARCRHAIPTLLPLNVSAKAVVAALAEHWTINWIRMWALTLGAIALSLALLLFFADNEPVATAFVRIDFAAIIDVVLREFAQDHEHG
jgi:hypothetical protein